MSLLGAPGRSSTSPHARHAQPPPSAAESLVTHATQSPHESQRSVAVLGSSSPDTNARIGFVLLLSENARSAPRSILALDSIEIPTNPNAPCDPYPRKGLQGRCLKDLERQNIYGFGFPGRKQACVRPPSLRRNRE